MNYKGVIIEESLTDTSIIEELEIVQTEVEKVTERHGTTWLDKWTMQTVLIPEGKIDEYAKRLSNLIDVSHCSDWYCDFRNEKYHYVIFSNKVFKLDKSNKNDYDEMRKYAVALGLPEAQLPSFNDLPISFLLGFLIEAKKETYANASIEKVKSSRLGSNDYHYENKIQEEKMIYHDTYFGGTKFIGCEVVYREGNTPKWGMNYYGVTLDSNLSEEAMDKALRPALMRVGEDKSVLPVRGPARLENEGYVYTFKSEGEIDNFTGVEEIYKDGKLIYRLCCHGGVIE